MKAEGYLWKRCGVYQSRKTIRRQVLTWSTKTGDKALAKRRAIDHWRAVMAEEYELVDRQASKRERLVTLGEVQDAYLAWQVERPSQSTRRQNANMLRSVVRLGHGKWDAALPVSVLSEALVERFQAARLEAAEDRERAKFGANSMLVQARAVFRSTAPFRAAKLELPDLSGFRKAPRFSDVSVANEFRPFTAGELARLERMLPRLRAALPSVWVVAVLMLYGGLRNSEVLRATRDWILTRDVRDGETWWCSVARSKTARGVRMVPLPDWVARGVLEVADAEQTPSASAPQKPSAPSIVAVPKKTLRQEITHRRINEWVRRVLPGRTAYDFRRQAGSWVLDEQGLQAAADFLGHQDTQTTVRWYASRIRALRPVEACRPLDLAG